MKANSYIKLFNFGVFFGSFVVYYFYSVRLINSAKSSAMPSTLMTGPVSATFLTLGRISTSAFYQVSSLLAFTFIVWVSVVPSSGSSDASTSFHVTILIPRAVLLTS